MSVSNIIKDLATGDASSDDVYAQEALGRINVSSAIFEAAYLISEATDGELEQIVLEAAADKNLPTDKEGAVAVTIASVKKELTAYYDLIIATAKKLKSASAKNMTVITQIGKKLGVPKSNDFSAYINSVCDAVKKSTPKGVINLSERKFIKKKYAEKMAENYTRGICHTLAAYGVKDPSLDATWNDSAILKVVRLIKSTKEIKDLRDVETNLAYGGALIANSIKITDDQNNYTDTIKADDLRGVAMALYTTTKVADAVVRAASSQKKAVLKKTSEIVDACTIKTRVTRSCESINDGIKEWAKNLNDIVDKYSHALGFSISELLKALSNNKAK